MTNGDQPLETWETVLDFCLPCLLKLGRHRRHLGDMSPMSPCNICITLPLQVAAACASPAR